MDSRILVGRHHVREQTDLSLAVVTLVEPPALSGGRGMARSWCTFADFRYARGCGPQRRRRCITVLRMDGAQGHARNRRLELLPLDRQGQRLNGRRLENDLGVHHHPRIRGLPIHDGDGDLVHHLRVVLRLDRNDSHAGPHHRRLRHLDHRPIRAHPTDVDHRRIQRGRVVRTRALLHGHLRTAHVVCHRAAAVGFLANPLDRVVGNDGLVFAARDAGLEVASGLANGGNTSGNADQQIDTIKSTLVDTFLRQPTQLINFGVVLDAPDNNGKCVKEFDEAYAATPDGPGVMDKVQEKVGDILPGAGAALDLLNPDDKPEDRIKDAIAACDGDDGPMKQYADNPGPGQAMGLLFLIFAGTLLMLFAIYLAGRLVLAVGVSIGNAIKSIPGIVVAIAPSMRGQFWRTIANVAMSLLQMMFSIVFLVGYVLVVQDLFASDESNLIRTVFFVDIFLIVALLLFRRAIKGLQRMSDSLASILAKRPDAAPTSITRSTPTSGRDIALMAAQGRQIYRGGKAAVQGAGKIAKKATTSTKAVGSVAGTATSTAVTGGVAAAVWAGTKAVSGAKKAKKSIDNLSDPATTARSQSSGSRSSTSSPSRGTGADSAAAAVRSRLSKSAVADKPGIKKSIGTAPSGLAPERGRVRSSASKTVAPDGRAFREFTTDSGAPLLLPTTPTRAPKAPKPTAAPAHPPAAPVVPAVNIPTGSGSRTAGLMAAAAQAGTGNARTPQPSSLTRRPR